MAKRGKLQKLLTSRDTFGRTVVKYFSRLPKDFFRQLEFDHWYEIHVAAVKALEKKAKKGRRKAVERLQRIREVAFRALRRKLEPRSGKKTKGRASPPRQRRMFVETQG